MREHPIKQEIISATICVYGDEVEEYCTGTHVTRIEACTKSGMHADIPYIRVWAGDRCIGEFCQHSIIGIRFGEPVERIGR